MCFLTFTFLFFCLNFRNRTERRIHDKIFCKISSELCGLNILKNTLEGINLSKVVQKLLEVRLLDFDLKLAVCFVEHLLFKSSNLKSRWVFLCFSFLWQKKCLWSYVYVLTEVEFLKIWKRGIGFVLIHYLKKKILWRITNFMENFSWQGKSMFFE